MFSWPSAQTGEYTTLKLIIVLSALVHHGAHVSRHNSKLFYCYAIATVNAIIL